MNTCVKVIRAICTAETLEFSDKDLEIAMVEQMKKILRDLDVATATRSRSPSLDIYQKHTKFTESLE